jgi:putative endonuclease
MDRRQKGTTAEAVARDFLLAQGLTPLLENYRCRLGELDLVLLERGVLVVVEVRLRADERFGGAGASVDYIKQRRIVRATRHLLLTRRELRQLPIRFDVIAFDAAVPATSSIRWLRSAFDVGNSY